MGWFLKFAGGLQGQLIILAGSVVLAFSTGWTVCSWKFKAADRDNLVEVIEGVTSDAKSKIKSLDKDWREAMGHANEAIEAAGKLRQDDANREAATLRELKVVQDGIKKLGSKIPTLANVGTCSLDDDFIKLWNDLRSAARTGNPETGSTDTSRSDSAERTDGVYDGVRRTAVAVRYYQVDGR